MTPPGDLRPDLYVVARLLEALWRNGNRLKPTQLQLAAGINYTRFERYIEFLEARRLVSRRAGTEDDTWIELTPAGHDALRFLAQGLREIFGATSEEAPRRGRRFPPS